MNTIKNLIAIHATISGLNVLDIANSEKTILLSVAPTATLKQYTKFKSLLKNCSVDVTDVEKDVITIVIKLK